MTYIHLTPIELVMIEAYFTEKVSVTKIAHSLGRSRQTIYNVVNYLAEGHSVSDYYSQYKENKRRCGRKAIVLPQDQQTYIRKMGQRIGHLMSLLDGKNSQLAVQCGRFIVNSSKDCLI